MNLIFKHNDFGLTFNVDFKIGLPSVTSVTLLIYLILFNPLQYL